MAGNRDYKKSGTFKFIFDGITTVYQFPHGLEIKPIFVNLSLKDTSDPDANSYALTWDDTNITITFTNPVVTSTNECTWFVYRNALSNNSQLGIVVENDFESSAFSKVGLFVDSFHPQYIDFSGGSGNFEEYLQYNSWVSGSNKFKISSKHRTSAQGGGMSTIFNSNNAGSNVNKARMYCSTTNDVYSGLTTLVLYDGLGSQNGFSSPTRFPTAVGDIILQEMVRDIAVDQTDSILKYRLTATSTNLGPFGTANLGSSIISAFVSYDYPTTNELNNTFKIGFGQIGGSNQLIDFSLTLNDLPNCDLLFIGDSKTAGLHTSNPALRYANLTAAQLSKTFEISGGPSGRVDTMIDALEELKLYRAKKAIIFIGCNDTRGSSGAIAGTISKLQMIKAGLESVGTVVIMVTPAPENGYDFTAFKNAFVTAFPAAADFWTPFVVSTNQLNPTYTIDGVHFNNAGQVIAKNILIPLI